MRTLVWYRGKDLRVADHEPLTKAARSGDAIPLFVLDPYFFAPARARELPHRMQFLLESLNELASNLSNRGSRLLVVKGKSAEIVPRLAKRWKADRVVAHRWVEPFGQERDRRVQMALNVPFELFEGETLLPPGILRTGSGTPYSVFTPFARAFRQLADIGRPRPAPKSLPPLPSDVTADTTEIPTCEALGIRRNPMILQGGERNARGRLRRFIKGAAHEYHRDRDRMDRDGTSRLSADLKFGTLSIRTVWYEVDAALGETESARTFLNELIWREFNCSTLWDRPHLLETPFRQEFLDFPWVNDSSLWHAWVEGRTGYPVVDAAARQLLGEGFVHNRARMITASFLTKHLLIDYRRGEAHYMKLLIDGDWAQNNAGWQWSAGCGCDAQPYFRIFNPVTQGQKFDPGGDYVRRWIPELARLPAKYIHQPWATPDAVLSVAGIRLGEDYPHPIVDLHSARIRYLELARRHLGGSAKC
jgi:deoxyribodipyrimidine photo-lyase